MQWIANCEPISETVHHYKISDSSGSVLSFDDVIELWSSRSPEGRKFRSFTVQTLAESPFEAFRWETPVVDLKRKDREFEFVLLNSPGLNRREDRRAFEQQFEAASPGERVIEFLNLGRDAILVVPTPRSCDGLGFNQSLNVDFRLPADGKPDANLSGTINRCHLASYLRSASAEQADQLWQKVGAAMIKRLSDKPVWLSTAGGGVPWLHVRLDDFPKYYGYQPFRRN